MSGTAGPSGVKVLMMVDNTIDGDSRVQKSARSVAEAGYDVTLLGRSPSAATDEQPLGQARRLRVPVPFLLETGRRRAFRFSLRHPLSYPTADRMAIQHRAVEVRRRQLQTRAARGDSGPGLQAARGWAVALRKLHTLRSRQYRAAVRAATPDDSARMTARARRLRRRHGTGCWRWLEPRLLDYEVSFAPVIESIRPDVLHAHDYRMIGVAMRAALRMRAAGHPVRVIYDAHEFLPGVEGPSPYWQIAHEAYEADHIGQVDAIVTVSDEMAERLVRQHNLPVRPSVVMNCPPVPDRDGGGSGDLRSVIGLAADVPLLVHVGVVAAKRGIALAVRALPMLPGVHVALVSRPGPYIDELHKLAAQLGVADRLHVVGYVPVEDVVPFISTATVGLMPLTSTVNHEVTIATKFFDYALARLPLVCSDMQAMGGLIRATGNGELHPPGDLQVFVAAVQKVLADLPRYRKPYDQEGLLESWTWQAQAGTLATCYQRLLASPLGTPVPTVPTVGR